MFKFLESTKNTFSIIYLGEYFLFEKNIGNISVTDILVEMTIPNENYLSFETYVELFKEIVERFSLSFEDRVIINN